MTSNTSESGTHLTTSRIRRLLRPLRNKCNGLAALPKAAPTSRVTYSRQPCYWDPDSRPPLAVLFVSAGTKRLSVDKCSADDFEFSRRIHAVCDAFKNVTHVAFGQPCSDRIPSLAAICTLVVGKNLPAETSDSLPIDSCEDSIDENDKLDVDGIYEAVPPHYRRFLIVSHALSMILRVCGHHQTLVTILLDHCLSLGLIHESTLLLNIVLAQAFLPSNSSYPPPVTHPAHTNYLFDLHQKWITRNNLYGASSSSLLFTTSVFCQVVLSTLSQSSSINSHLLWTSKALDKLLRVVEGYDIDSYVYIIHAFSRSFTNLPDSSPDAIRDDTHIVMLRDKLSSLMSNLFELLFTQCDPHPSPPVLPRINAAIDLLVDCHTARLHCLQRSTPGSSVDLSDMIIIFATHIFVAFRHLISGFDRLLAILDDSNPNPTTFSRLMVYFSRHQEGQDFEEFAEAFLSELKKYSSVLCSEKLFGLDASFWACALHHFEATMASSQKSTSIVVTRYRQQFMEAVDAAEHRCFGGDLESSPVVSLPVHSKRARRGKLSGHWEWEDMVGSWIRMTPVHKKRKIEDGRPPIPSRYSRSRPRNTTISKAGTASGSLSVSMPLPTCHRYLSSPSSSFSLLSEPEYPTEDGSEYQDEADKENHSSDSPPVIQQPHPDKRRNSNFFSLLADAQMNRIALHPKPYPKKKPSPPDIPEKHVPPLPSQQSRVAPRKSEQKTSYRKVTTHQAPPRTLLLSDDSLNLFAYATSSPVRC